MLLNKNTLGLRQHMLIETKNNSRSCAYKSAQERVAHTHTPVIFISAQACKDLCLSPPQVPLVSMVWLGTAGPAREDLRGHRERPATPGRRDLRVSWGIVRQPCAWLHRRTHPRGYRRQEQLKDPIFRSTKFHSSALKSKNKKRRGRPLFLAGRHKKKNNGDCAPSDSLLTSGTRSYHNPPYVTMTTTRIHLLPYFFSPPLSFPVKYSSSCSGETREAWERVHGRKLFFTDTMVTFMSPPALCKIYPEMHCEVLMPCFLQGLEQSVPVKDFSLTMCPGLNSICVYHICKLEWNPRITSCVHCPPPFTLPSFLPKSHFRN